MAAAAPVAMTDAKSTTTAASPAAAPAAAATATATATAAKANSSKAGLNVYNFPKWETVPALTARLKAQGIEVKSIQKRMGADNTVLHFQTPELAAAAHATLMAVMDPVSKKPHYKIRFIDPTPAPTEADAAGADGEYGGGKKLNSRQKKRKAEQRTSAVSFASSKPATATAAAAAAAAAATAPVSGDTAASSDASKRAKTESKAGTAATASAGAAATTGAASAAAAAAAAGGDDDDAGDDDELGGGDEEGGGGGGGGAAVAGRPGVNGKAPECIADVVIPYWRYPYEIQLKKKQYAVEKLLRKTAKQLRSDFPNLKFNGVKGLLCVLGPIVPSPITEHYRNKCEFAIANERIAPTAAAAAAATAPAAGAAAAAAVPTNSATSAAAAAAVPTQRRGVVGYTASKFSDAAGAAGFTVIAADQPMQHLAPVAISLAKVLTNFINTTPSDDKTAAHTGGYACYDRATHKGVWRMCIIRHSVISKETMLNVQVDPTSLSASQFATLKADFVSHFQKQCIDAASGWSATVGGQRLTSIILQVYEGVSESASSGTMEVLYGPAHLRDHMSGLTFQVSPHAFFQVNTIAAEKLYSIATEWGRCTPRTTLLDICCGTGTIGLTIARRVHKVIGLEIIQSAIDDANVNAKLNNISNVEYICGKAEETLSRALAAIPLTNASTATPTPAPTPAAAAVDTKEPATNIATVAAAASDAAGASSSSSAAVSTSGDDICAIVDPPRGGLHPEVIRLLRSCTRLKRMVYVSCNPKSLVENLKRLMRPANKKLKGLPFRAVQTVAVDMFPHTPHCEMVMLLER